MTAIRIPASTYRIQLNIQFRFSDARDLVPYLHELGVTDLYASPRFKARKGSSHGYDVADPQRISSELGTEEEFEELIQKLKHYGMGLLLDIVPNHMAASSENPWWMDVLENGPSSAYASYFDIDWHPATTKALFLQENKVLLPVLGDLYGSVLENQELNLKLDETGFYVRYYEHKFPLDPRTYRPILERCLVDLPDPAGPAPASESAGRGALRAILEETDGLPHFTTAVPGEAEERRRLGAQIKQRVWRLYHQDADLRKTMEESLRQINGTRGDQRSFDLLDQILAAQPYRLAHWKIGLEEINYRRFFDINDLVRLRVEDPKVFDDRHAHIARLVQEEKVTGLRVDHVDGLYDPLDYLHRLQRSANSSSESPESPRLYVVVEKILGENEVLPPEWPISGTTGYDFLNAVNAVFIDPQGLELIEAAYARFVGASVPFAEICYSRNKQVMEQLFAAEVHALSHQLAKLAAQDRQARDLPLSELIHLLIEVTACLPVYRTYMRSFEIESRDRAFIERTLELARGRAPVKHVSDAAFAFLRRVLLLDPPYYAEDQREEWLRFVMGWQQFSGPVMAKGLEDTALYVHCSLVSLNEVGSDPLRESPPLDVEAFHLFNQARQARSPDTMNATSTHDTKRSEDVRARINVLSEFPEEWEGALRRWSRWNHSKKRSVAGHVAPSPGEESLLYQTLLGAWPLEEDEISGIPDRVKAYMWKAAREAKVSTSWINPNVEHEEAVVAFVEAILDASAKNRFLTDFLRFQKLIAHYGAFNALSQVLLKTVAPGVPDFYQGSELWDFNLVDPDNRRPVDFERRAHLLEEIKARESKDPAGLARELLESWPDGRIKLYTIWRTLNFRGANPVLFLQGEYIPLAVSTGHRENICAFARRLDDAWVLAVVPRLLSRLVDPGQLPVGREVWGKGNLLLPRGAPAHWQNLFTGETLKASSAGRKANLSLEAVFQNFPVALLKNSASP